MPSENVAAVLENVRSTALSLYEQYLGEKSEQKMQMKPALSQALYFKIRNLNEKPSEVWFDNVIEVVFERMANEYLISFKKSKAYIKLLQELDLLQQGNPDDDNLSINSNESSDSNENLTTTQSSKIGDFLQVDCTHKNVKHVRSLSDVTMLTKQEKNVRIPNTYDEKNVVNKTTELVNESEENIAGKLKVGDFKLSINIIETGKCEANILNQ